MYDDGAVARTVVQPGQESALCMYAPHLTTSRVLSSSLSPGRSLLGPGCRTIKFALSSVGTPPAEGRSTRKLPTDPKRRAVREWLTTRSITPADLQFPGPNQWRTPVSQRARYTCEGVVDEDIDDDSAPAAPWAGCCTGAGIFVGDTCALDVLVDHSPSDGSAPAPLGTERRTEAGSSAVTVGSAVGMAMGSLLAEMGCLDSSCSLVDEVVCVFNARSFIFAPRTSNRTLSWSAAASVLRAKEQGSN